MNGDKSPEKSGDKSPHSQSGLQTSEGDRVFRYRRIDPYLPEHSLIPKSAAMVEGVEEWAKGFEQKPLKVLTFDVERREA